MTSTSKKPIEVRKDESNPSDAEIKAYLEYAYPDGTDAHYAPAPTVDEVRRAIQDLNLAAALLGPKSELSHMRANNFEVADEVLGCFIRAANPGDAYYVALEFRKPSYSELLKGPLPERIAETSPA